MRSNLLKRLTIAATLFSVTGCGLLGQKDTPAATSSVGAGGCLDNSKDLVNRYITGEMSQTEWTGAFTCVNDSLKFFTEWVHGSNQNAYTQGDMYTLVTKFLITNGPVHIDLLNGAFSLKSALFGGDSQQFTKDEIDLLKTSLTRLSQITADLIPYLQLRQESNPPLQNVLEMTTAFKRAGDQLGDYVATLPTGYLTQDALTTLINELSTTLNIPLIDNLGQKIFLAKWLVFNTRADTIEQTDWPQFFRTAMSLSGILLAYKTAVGPLDPNNPNQVMDRLKDDYRFREFIWNLVEQAKPYIDNSIAAHGGITPFPLFDHVIDNLPDDILPDVQRDILKRAIRPLFRRFLLSSSQEGVDQQLVDTVYGLGSELVAQLGLLDRFYEQTGLDRDSASPTAMTTDLNQFASTLKPDDLARFTNVKNAILNYKPLFFKNSGSILFDQGVGYSRYQALLSIAVTLVGTHLQKTYGSSPGVFLVGDFTSFFTDYSELLNALKLVDGSIIDYGRKRFQEVDLFTPVSDGNQQVSMPELVNYAMIIASSATLGSKMQTEITHSCDIGLGTDPMGWTWLPANCFRLQFHDRLAYWLDNFPHLKAFWLTLTVAEQQQAMMWLEHGTRLDGYNNKNLGKDDIGAFATVLHYTESLFTRFDQNSNDTLSKSEIGNAYPVFKSLIAKKANLGTSSDYLLKGIFTYIVKYREMPDTSNIGSIAQLAWWLVKYDIPTTKYSADRTGVFNIVCQLAAPQTADQQAATKTICKP